MMEKKARTMTKKVKLTQRMLDRRAREIAMNRESTIELLWCLEQRLDEHDPHAYCSLDEAQKRALDAFARLTPEEKVTVRVLMLRELQKYLAKEGG